MKDAGRRIYEFGPFRLDVRERRLRRGAEDVPLADKSFEVLVALLERRGSLVAKDELMKKGWPDAVVEEQQITSNVSILRKALGDNGTAQRYIQTVPKRGYRFRAEGEMVGGDDEGGAETVVAERTRSRVIIEEMSEPAPTPVRRAGDELESDPAAALPAPLRRRFKRLVLAAGGVLAVTLLIAGWYAFQGRAERAPSVRSIAVLPFKPLVAGSADPALELGMTDALISRLGNIREITVRPTSSVLKYAAEGQDLRAAAAALGVETLLDGKVQRAGGRVRLSVQLVRASDGATVWADKFDAEMTDIFAVQDAISERVASALALHLTGEERRGLSKRYTENVEAYQLYLKGEFHWRTFRLEDLRTSINYYGAALEKDPRYALAYAGMAKSYNVINLYSPRHSPEADARAREAAHKAVELDPDLAEAYVALGANKLFAWEWEDARRALERAIALDPSTVGHAPYGYYFHAMGRPEEALAQLRRAAELAPEWQLAGDDVLYALFFARRYEEAAAECRRAIDLNPNNYAGYYMLGQTYAQTGRPGEAVALLERGLAVGDEHRRQEILAEMGYAHALAGDRATAADIVGRLLKTENRFAHMLVARVYAGLGDLDRAFASLDLACDERTPFLWEVRVMPQFDGLRTDRRYAELLRRMNLMP